MGYEEQLATNPLPTFQLVAMILQLVERTLQLDLHAQLNAYNLIWMVGNNKLSHKTAFGVAIKELI